MTSLRARRTAALLAGAALAASALVITGAGPASAVPVNGSITASSAGSVGSSCTLGGAPATQTVAFSNRTGGRTARTDASYSGTQSATVGASGHVSTETTASGTMKDRAFRRVDVESTSVALVKNDSDVDCALALTASSDATASLRVRHRGRIKISWSSSVGDLELISLFGEAGGSARDPSRPEGSFSMRVRPGTYELESLFTVAAAEAGVTVGATSTTVGFYTLKATFVS